MTTSYTSRIGTAPEESVKAPCVAATTTNITLSGEQTIDSVAVVSGNRVLVRQQTDPTENGIYDCSTSTWTRSTDFNDSSDVVNGILALDANDNILYQFTFTGAYSPGTTPVTVTDVATAEIKSSYTVADKTAAVLLSPISGKSLVVESDDGGLFKAATGASPGTYSDDGGSYCGTQFIPTGGDGSTAWVRVYSDAVNILWFGAVNDGITDSYAAIVLAINAVQSLAATIYVSSGKVLIPEGDYYCSANFELKSTVHLIGAGAGMAFSATAAPTLTFPAGVGGITVNADDTLNGGTIASTTTAAGTVIEGIRVSGNGGAAADGIWIRAKCLLRNVYVNGFSNNGINVVADAGGGGALEGNANNFRIEGGASYGNTNHGLFVNGADANAGVINGFDASNNGGWGIYDSSFLGNTYVGCHTANNTTGPYKSDDANARNLFLGCYSESGQPGSDIINPAMVVGGIHAAGFTSTTTGLLLYDRKFTRMKSISITDDTEIEVGYNASGDTTTYLSLTDTEDTTKPWRLHYEIGAWYLNWGNTSDHWLELYNKEATIANGFLRELGPDNNGGLGFPKGFYWGNDRIMRQIATTTPTSGTFLVGDILFEATPTAGGTIGTVCTTKGTQGTLNGGATTGGITISTPDLVVNDATDLEVGQFITIAGVSGVKRVDAISGLNITLDSNASATVSGAAVAYSTAVFKAWGTIAA